MFEHFKKDLENKKSKNLYRQTKLVEGLDFSSNDYLNLSNHPFIRKKMMEALEGGIDLSSKSSRLLCGTTKWHKQTERTLSQFTGRDSVLSFSSGYLANTGIIPALAKDKVLFSDELNHASLIDGIRLSKSPYKVYPHNDLKTLEELLKKETKEKIIITESLFSMKGDFAPLEEISKLAKKYNALLIVDEAHATGVFGEKHSGFVYDLKDKEHIVSIHTCGKALGSSGAFVASSNLIKDYLINNCRSFIYTTAPPPLLMVQWQAAIEVLQSESFRSESLKSKSLKFRKSLNLPETESPIVFINLKDSKIAIEKSSTLKQKGFYIPAIRPPTVPEGQAGLRIVLQYAHKQNTIEELKKYV